MLTWEKIGLSLTGDVGYGAYRTGADVWRSLPDMVVGDVCAQARRHLHTRFLGQISVGVYPV